MDSPFGTGIGCKSGFESLNGAGARIKSNVPVIGGKPDQLAVILIGRNIKGDAFPGFRRSLKNDLSDLFKTDPDLRRESGKVVIHRFGSDILHGLYFFFPDFCLFSTTLNRTIRAMRS